MLSVPMQSRSQPAASARTAASGMPSTPLAPAMSRASVTMTPSKPSSSRSRPLRIALRSRRASGSSCGSRMCEVMIVCVPAAIAARNGTSSRSRSCRRRAVDHGQREVGVRGGVAVSGEVLGAGGDAGRTARRRSRRRRARRPVPASAPKLRMPITGLSGLELTSTSGAKVEVAAGRGATPSRRRSPPPRWLRVVDPAEDRVAGKRRSGVVVEPGDVAALLVDRDDGARIGGPDGGGQLAQLRAGHDVIPEQADAAEPVAELLREPLGKDRAGEAGEQGGGDGAGASAPARCRLLW